jgi:hypothetical protein
VSSLPPLALVPLSTLGRPAYWSNRSASQNFEKIAPQRWERRGGVSSLSRSGGFSGRAASDHVGSDPSPEIREAWRRGLRVSGLERGLGGR